MADTDDDIGLKARSAAIDLVTAARERRGGFDDAAATVGFLKLSDAERAFARALALLVLRRLAQLDQIIASLTKPVPPEHACHLLRIGLAQIGYMQVPDFAAVSTTVKLAERDAKTRPYKGLVNAVLRNAIRKKVLTDPDPRQLVPDWLFSRWSATYGEEEAFGIAGHMIREPATDLSFATSDALAEAADALKGRPLGGLTLRSGLRGDLARWHGYEDGTWWVQDVSAALPVGLIEAPQGRTAIDLCAAPGGKTLQLAAAGAQVVALDRSKNRLKRITDNLARTGLEAEVVTGDAESFDKSRQFDIVLLDAPCSSTGTFRRQPDVLWATKPADIAKLADVQHRLLDAAAALTAPDGQLVYCVCSMEREEGETQILAFLRRHTQFRLTQHPPELLDTLGVPTGSRTDTGWLRLLPHHRDGGQDGFFVAVLRRVA